jgi:membrane dipeptidase
MRAKTDEAIKKLAQGGGVMGIAFIRFLVREQEPVTIEFALDQFDYVAKLVGIEHVAVGSDLDVFGEPQPKGGGFQPNTQPNFDRYKYHEDKNGKITIEGLNHPRRMFDLAEGLIRRGYTDAQIGSVLGGNAIRVLGAAWTSTKSTPAKPPIKA